MASTPQPLFLLADSQLLFWHTDGALWLRRLRRHTRPTTAEQPLRAAYLGASNGDRPVFYELFVAAMAGLDLHDCRHIPAQPSPADREYLDRADLILLSGGDPQLGWAALSASGLHERLLACYQRGALLLGISAGAMLLGLLGWAEHAAPSATRFAALGLVPYIVSAHAEPEWRDLRLILPGASGQRGLGIRSGGGAICYPDGSLEAVRQPLDLFKPAADGLRQRVLAPLR